MQIIDRQFFITIVIIVNIPLAAPGQFARLLCMGGYIIEAEAAVVFLPAACLVIC